MSLTPQQVRDLAVHYKSIDRVAWLSRWPNFAPEEIACRGTGLVPQHEAFQAALDRLQALRVEFGTPLIVSSAYRSPEHNARTKGAAKKSKHMLGIAFDVGVANVDPRGFELAARRSGFQGIGRYPLSRFIHIDARDKPATWGSDWPPGAARFDETTERPDGIEGMAQRLYRRFLAWVAGGGSIAVIIEYSTNIVQRMGAALKAIPLPSLQTILFAGAALVLLALAFTWVRDLRSKQRNTEDEHAENPDIYQPLERIGAKTGLRGKLRTDHGTDERRNTDVQPATNAPARGGGIVWRV